MEPPKPVSRGPVADGTPPAPPGGTAPQPPPYRLYFEVLKGGIVVEEVDLCSATQLLFGRQADVVDIELAHPSISRRHCYVQHAFVPPTGTGTGAGDGDGDGGAVEGGASEPPRAATRTYLYDLGSQWGTFLNKAKLPPRTHCAVRVGDHIRFGESSRSYVLSGPADMLPAEYDSSGMQAYRDRRQRQRQRQRQQQRRRQSGPEEQLRGGDGESNRCASPTGKGGEAREKTHASRSARAPSTSSSASYA